MFKCSTWNVLHKNVSKCSKKASKAFPRERIFYSVVPECNGRIFSGWFLDTISGMISFVFLFSWFLAFLKKLDRRHWWFIINQSSICYSWFLDCYSQLWVCKNYFRCTLKKKKKLTNHYLNNIQTVHLILRWLMIFFLKIWTEIICVWKP